MDKFKSSSGGFALFHFQAESWCVTRISTVNRVYLWAAVVCELEFTKIIIYFVAQ